MLRFSVFVDGKPARKLDLTGAHLIGSDGVPVRADIKFADGQIQCTKRTTGPAGLSLLWSVGGSRLMQETTRLPERDKPYVLQLELLRGRLMRLAQKREDWGLFDFEGVEEIDRSILLARDALIEALQADTPAQSARIAQKGMALGLTAAEGLTAFHAEIFLNRRRQVNGFSRHMIGCVVDPSRTDDAYRERIASICDYITIPFTWKLIEPKEQSYRWQLLDDWMDWALQHKLSVRAGSLISFAESQVPDWLFIWEHDFETIRDLVCEHIRRVIGRYGRYVNAWEVISGVHGINAISFNFEQLIELTRVSTAVAKQAAPRSTVIIDLVNPWGDYYARNQRTIPPVLYAEMAVQSGVNFDAFGLQCYFGVGAEGMYMRDIFHISSMLDRFGQLGRPLHITGLAAPSAMTADPYDAWKGRLMPESGGQWHKPWTEELQRAWMRRVYHIALSKPFIDAIAWRDYCDGGNHLLPHGGLLRRDISGKPSLEELASIRRELIDSEPRPEAAVS